MNNGQNKRIPFFRYFPLSVKFYGLRNEKLAAIIFIIMLVINFISSQFALKLANSISISDSALVSDSVLSSQNLVQMYQYMLRMSVISLLSFVVSSIIVSYYTYAFIRDLRGIQYTLLECFSTVSKKLLSITVLSVIIALSIIFGSLVFIIPGLILYLMFIFSFQYLVDQDKGVFYSLKSSISLTSGYKSGIFVAVLMLNLISIFISSFIDVGNGEVAFSVVSSFVSAFISTIFNIIYQRFLTLIYFDLEYIRKPNNFDIKV